MDVYIRIKENLLYPIFKSLCKDDDAETVDVETNECIDYANELMAGIWYSELYKIFFKNIGGFYHNVVQFALSNCQMILFEAYDNVGTFITSDNPAFEHKSSVVDHRFADTDTVKKFNRIINAHKTEIIISSSKNLKDVT